MRSATYGHGGEQLTCAGCHERRGRAPTATGPSRALVREPSEIQPEPEGSNPLSFPRLVQPVLEMRCVRCHQFRLLRLSIVREILNKSAPV